MIIQKMNQFTVTLHMLLKEPLWNMDCRSCQSKNIHYLLHLSHFFLFKKIINIQISCIVIFYVLFCSFHAFFLTVSIQQPFYSPHQFIYNIPQTILSPLWISFQQYALEIKKEEIVAYEINGEMFFQNWQPACCPPLSSLWSLFFNHPHIPSDTDVQKWNDKQYNDFGVFFLVGLLLMFYEQ